MPALDQLVSISAPISRAPRAASTARYLQSWGELGAELLDLLDRRNGLWAFRSALQVFPGGLTPGTHSLESWNEPSLWTDEYRDFEQVRKCLFFAQDIFGLQFCLHEDRVALFDPETAAVEPFAASVEEWAQRLLLDHDVLCGTSLVEQWVSSGQALPQGTRLIPKVPFVAGGSSELSNLYAGEIVAAMRFRATFAKQIRDLPDGAKVRLVPGP